MYADSGRCVPTALAPAPATVTGKYAPLTLSAKLTAGAGPVSGAPVNFYVTVHSPTEKPRAGFVVGNATTGGDGTAMFVRPQGTDGLTLGDEKPASFEVQFNPSTKIGGVQYCQTRADAPITGG